MTEKAITGKTTLAPEVLLTIARMSTLGVEGVNRIAAVPGGFGKLFRRGMSEGVQVSIEDGLIYMDLFVVLNQGVNVREVSRQIQQHVTRALSEMVGMEVGQVNIHIEDIDFSSEK